MNQNEEDVESRQFKFRTQCTGIVFYLIHFTIIVAIIIVASLCLQNNQNSVQVVQWCTIELTLIIYHLLQQIYELGNQFYFIDLIISNPYQLVFRKNKQEYFQLNFYTRYLSSNIFLICNNTYIQVLLFSANNFFRETIRKIPGTEKWSKCYDQENNYYPCLLYDVEIIAPQYHGPYLTELANLNITLFSFQCLYLLYRLTLLKVFMDYNKQLLRYNYDIKIQSIKKESQILCIILTLYYIFRVTHSFIIYPQVKNETLLYSIGAYIFYSIMMITVLISIIILIQLKLAQEQENIYSFITVFSLIDSIIYDNRYLKYYLRIMLQMNCIFYIYEDQEIQDIVNYQNYVLADLIIAQIILISVMLIKYAPLSIPSLFCYQKIINNLSNINYNQVQQQNLNPFTSQEDQKNQNHKKQANIINQNKRSIKQNWVKQFKQFLIFLQKKSIFSRSIIHFRQVNVYQNTIKQIHKQKNHNNNMHSIKNVKIIKFWKQKTKIPSDFKKRRLNFMICLRKTNKQQEDLKQNTLYKEIKFIDQQYLGECTICLEQFEILNKTKNIIRLNCFGHHIFHSDCIQNWFKYNKKCPLCNSNQIKITVS